MRGRDKEPPQPPAEFLLFEPFREYNHKPSRAPLGTRLAKRALGVAGATVPTAILGVMPFVGINYDVGPLHMHVTPTLTGDSQFGFLGTTHIPKSNGRIGLKATPEGVPIQTLDGTSSVGSLLSPATLTTFAEIYDQPQKSLDDAENKLKLDWLEKASYAECALLLAGAGTKKLVQRHAMAFTNPKALLGQEQTVNTLLAPYFNPTAKATAVILAVQAVAGVGVTALPVHPSAPESCKIHSLDGTLLEGTWTCQDPVHSALEDGAPIVINEIASQKQTLESFERHAIASIEAQKDLIAQPRDGEFATWETSDLHDSIAMTAVYTYLANYLNIEAFSSNGDDVDGGLPAEERFVKNEAGITSVDKVEVPGNHNSNVTTEQLIKYAFEVLNGDMVKVAGLNFLGDKDPNRTELLSNTVQAGDESNAQMGERLLELARKLYPDVFMVHESEAAQAIVRYIQEGHQRIASLVLWGHNHTQEGPYTVWNTDGTWTVICQLGTAGGYAPGTSETVNLPSTPPTKPATSIQFFWNKTSKLVTGYQVIVTHRNGHTTFKPRVNVGNPGGLPNHPPFIGMNSREVSNAIAAAVR